MCGAQFCKLRSLELYQGHARLASLVIWCHGRILYHMTALRPTRLNLHLYVTVSKYYRFSLLFLYLVVTGTIYFKKFYLLITSFVFLHLAIDECFSNPCQHAFSKTIYLHCCSPPRGHILRAKLAVH